MAQTKAGGLKAAKTNKERHGQDFYKRIGHIGGSVKTDKPKGFAVHRELAAIAGAKGGKISRRTGVKNGRGKTSNRDIDLIERDLEVESGRN